MNEDYRDYTQSSYNNNVELTYKTMLENQHKDYVVDTYDDYFNKSGKPRQIWDLMESLNTIVDDSDPDTNLPQIVHLYQTAEAIRSNYIYDSHKLIHTPIHFLFSETEWNNLSPEHRLLYNTSIDKLYSHITDWRWFILVGFIHDLGKILLLKEYGGFPQWSVVGDTFPVGAKLSSNYPFYHKNYHANNSDLTLDTYIPKCGFTNVMFSWGHDEYLAKTLELNETLLPKEAIYIIRYHSFYSWHTPSNGKRGYSNLASNYDWYMLPLLKCFQKADLYSKSEYIPDITTIKSSYDKLIQQYIPEGILDVFTYY